MFRILLLAFLLPAPLFAQFTYVLDNSIPVEVDKVSLPMAWAGGINTAQYNTMDLNEDGKDDLVLYDRMATKVMTFLRVESTYQYAPEYEKVFPAEIENWLLLRDYNCDGRKDIFTGDIFGIKVYTNTSHDGNIAWEKFMFYNGVGGAKSGALLTKGLSPTKNNLQLQYDDLPSIVDADGDGDFDIFNMIYPNGNTIEYHQNMSVENYASCDSLDFKRVVRNWGGVTECSCGTFAFNNEACNEGGRTEHAGGKSLLALDANGDTKIDIVISEATCSFLSLLSNQGDLTNPVISSASFFPQTNFVNFPIYPAVYFEDVDFDGVKDIIATPNIYAKTFFDTDLKRSNWFYKNTGTNSSPSLTFVEREFLQKGMIDLGDNSIPAFMDYDADGDLDMFVSTNTSDITVSTIRLFENTGTGNEPAFKLIEEDFLDLSSKAYYNLKIQFADITNDGKPDLVFTATWIFENVPRLGFIPNKSFNGVSFSLNDINFITLPGYTMARNENVTVVDVNGDGKSDLLIGRSNGTLNYWKNIGIQTYSLENEEYLGLVSSVLRQNLMCAAADLNGDGDQDLVLGDNTGQLRIVDNFRKAGTAETAAENIIWNARTQVYESRNLGGQVWPTVANIFATRKPAIVIGNTLGGLTILRHDNEGELPKTPLIDLYPNPLQKSKLLYVLADRPMEMQIFSVTGQILTQPVTVLANQPYSQDTSGFKAGVYIMRFTVNQNSFVRRFVVY
ncbi:MAG TPA: T9SS type A sorting domain-containing protein [Ohtaekwangia sp.]